MKINKLFITLSIVASSLLAAAQGGTQSPYSFLGLGELSFQGFTQHSAMGGTSLASTSAFSFTPLNPASYANLKFTVYDAGLSVRTGQFSTESGEQDFSSGNFDHFAMAFPFYTKKKMAVTFGTNQYSDVGYNVQNTINTDTPSYQNIYKGEGGINRVFVGYGLELLPNLNLGVNANFNFGNILRSGATVYSTTANSFSYLDETNFAYRGVDFDFGVQYSVYDSVRFLKSGSAIKHTIGLTAHSGSELRGEGLRLTRTFIGPLFPRIETIDVIRAEDVLDTLEKPLGYGIGYTIQNGEHWALSLEMQQYMWSQIAAKRGIGAFYKNNTRLAAGLSWVPEPKYAERGNYLKKVRYSLGGSYQSLYYNLEDNDLTQFGISFGLGLPIVKSVRVDEEKLAIVNTINLVAEYVKTGSTSNGLIQEDYFNIGIGLNLNDKWFTKRKYR